MYKVVTAVTVNGDQKIVITNMLQTEQGKDAALLLQLILEVPAAGRLARSIEDAINGIMAQNANVLPDKKYEPIAGRNNA